jgi:simple sugar transport system permease protein
MVHRLRAASLQIAAVALGLAVGVVLIALQGKNPANFFVAIWRGGFDGKVAIGRTLEKATPLILSGVAIIVGLKAGLFNIGAQGQLVVGALISAYLGYRLHLPRVLHVPLLFVIAPLAAAVPAVIAGVLKVTRGVNEVITTIMLNSVILSLTDWVAGRPWRSKTAAFARTSDIQGSAKIPRVADLPTGFLVALAAAALVWFMLSRTTLGFRLSAVGANRNAAHYAGISVAKITVLAMGISGFLAGVGGTIESLGVLGHYEQGTSSTLGFDGITIALLSRLNPRATIPAAILIGAMRASDAKLQNDARVAPEIVSVIVAVILLFVAAPALVRGILRWKTAEEGEQVQLTKGWGS